MWGLKPGAIVAAFITLFVGFGGGYLAAKILPTKGGGVLGASTGFHWPLFGKPRAGDAPRAGVVKPDGFTVWTSRIQIANADPVSCLRMTRTLDPRKSYSDFVLVSPDLGHPVGATVHADELCVAGLGYTGHQLTLLKGMPAQNGETLANDLKVDFGGSDQPPYVGFDGQGVILPREEADGVGIDTLNVSLLQVEVWRVADRNLARKTLSASDPTAEGDYSDDGDFQDDARSVWKGGIPVKSTVGQRAVTVFPLGAVLKTMAPGAYVVTARDASGVLGDRSKAKHTDDDRPARARRWIVFTDMGLSAYNGADALDVVVRSLKTARAIAGVRIALVASDGEELASTQTDGNGHVQFDHALLDGDGAAKATKLMAYGPGADFTLLDLNRVSLDLSNQLKGEAGRTLPGVKSTSGRAAATAVDGYLYTDRGIYRPGETVHLVAMMRDRVSRAVKDRKGALIIRRPSGTEFGRIRFGSTPDGAMVTDIALPRSAPRGGWKVALQMDGSDDPSGDTRFEVQDFAPERLAVTVSSGGDQPMTAGEIRSIQVNARFLYGAVGSGLSAETEARLVADLNPFPQYKEFRWGDEQAAFGEKLVQLPKMTTDGAGNASLTLAFPPAADAVQPLKANVTSSVLEPGGRPVTEAASVAVRPRPLYYGVRITQGGLGDEQTQTYDVIAVDATGRRIAAHTGSWTLISENWTYDWFEKDGRWGFHRTSRDAVIATGALEIRADRTTRITKRLPWGDYRLVLANAATGSRTVIRQSSGWTTNASDEDTPDTARVSAGGKTYAPGDTVPLHIQAPFAGEAEIAVASDRVIQLKTLSVPKGGVTVRLPVNATWGGGAYLLVSVIEARDPTSAPKPRRALGVVYVPVQPRGRVLTVELGATAKLDSRTPIAVPVQVKGLAPGASAHVTVAAVDEGILALTHQPNPDPVTWYFGRRALSVDYRDDYGRLLNPNLGAPAALNYGGDESGGGGQGLTATPIKTVALWSGLVTTDRDGHATVHLPAGAYNGQLRLMAVAWTDEAVGGGQEKVVVREPVVAELDLPRFLAPGDRADIGLELHNVEGRAGGYRVELATHGGLSALLRKTYDLVLGQRVLDHTFLTAPDSPGLGAVALQVSGPNYLAAVSYPLQTRVGWDAITRDAGFLQKPRESFTPTPDLLKGLSPGGLSMTVSYSPFRGFDPSPIAEVLQRYSYGCSEQLVSAAYPLLYAQEFPGSTGMRRAPAALTDTVIKLLDREGADGAFGLWRAGDTEADAWLGAYIVDFLVSARDRGQPVSEDALQRALKGMRLISKPDESPSIDYRLVYPDFWGGAFLTKHMRSRAAAYALYDLAKAHEGDLPRLRWFHDVQFADEPSPLAKAQVGAGLAMMGDRGRAHDSFVQAVKALGYQEPADWYQSPLRDLAAVIALAYEAGEAGIARNLQSRLEDRIRSPDDLNTQEQAHLLQAAHAMLAASGPMHIDAKGVRPLADARWAVGRLADARFVNEGSGALWRTVTVHGVPTSSPKPNGHGIALQKAFYAVDGKPLDPSILTQGERVVVRISGTSEQARAMMTVVDDPLPAGLEIETILQPSDADDAAGDTTRRGPEDKPAPKGPFSFLGALSQASMEEKHDDRFVAALTVPGDAAFAVAYVARAVTPGDFFMPGAAARDMYRPTVAARTQARRTQILPTK